MYIEVTQQGNVALVDEHDLKKFSVRAPQDCALESVGASLAAAGAGRLDGDHASISIEWLRRSTAGRPQSWQQDFDGMLAYAATKGWIDDDKTAVTAHIEKV